MISHLDIEERVREWRLRAEVVEKDYVIGWLLWGIGSDALLGEKWAFKGGTCLKKCYIETYRFSEDLDYTVLPDGPVAPSEIEGRLAKVLERVTEASGIDFSQRRPVLKGHPSGRYTAGRVYYIGPRRTPGVTSIKLDLSASEQVVRPTVMRAIAHPYPDALPEPRMALCYCFDEVFAEKLRALGERGRPRDLLRRGQPVAPQGPGGESGLGRDPGRADGEVPDEGRSGADADLRADTGAAAGREVRMGQHASAPVA